MSHSRVGQVQAPFDTLDADVHPIKAIGHIGILILKISDALLYLPDIIAHVIDRAADMAKVLKDDVFRPGHAVRLSQPKIIVNHGHGAVTSERKRLKLALTASAFCISPGAE
jgi:hypothetical protein